MNRNKSNSIHYLSFNSFELPTTSFEVVFVLIITKEAEMSLPKYEDIKPKNLHEFSTLYKRADKILRKLKAQLENAHNRPLNKNKLKHIFNLHFKIKHMAENYKYLQEKLNENNPQ